MDEENKLEDGDSELETPEEKETPIEKTEEEPEGESKEEPKEEKDKNFSSVLAQKKHWREQAQSFKKELEEMKSQLSEKIQKKENVSDDEAERKAQEYIDKRVEAVIARREQSQKSQEEKKLMEFESELEEVLEENTDLNDKDILDVCEKFKITPKLAANFINFRKTEGKPKPKIPSPKSANPEAKLKKEERVQSGDFWKVTEKLLKGLK